jgi:histidinol-phosphate phosphatase family protein
MSQSKVTTKSERSPAIFLDRDGTLIEDRGYLRSEEEVVFFPDTVASLRMLQQHFLLFIVSNQSGVAEGALTTDDVEHVNGYVVGHLRDEGVAISDIYWCPHRRSDGCICIKPNPYFLRQAAERHNVDLERSFTIGDHPHDVYFAQNVGARGVYVLSGHGQKHRGELVGDFPVVAGIDEAVRWILLEFTLRRAM